jgi:PAS domain S-box-containing protein
MAMAMQAPLIGSMFTSSSHTIVEDEAGQLLIEPEPVPALDANLLEQAFENSHDCIALVDMQGRVIYMNLPGSCLLGLDSRPPQQPVSWPELWSPEQRDLAEYSLEEVRCGHQCRFMACREMSSGVPRWWDVAVNPVFDSAGVPAQMFCVCRDVTLLKQAECSLQHQVAAKELLLAEASHRVKNHLASIAGALALQARHSGNETVRNLLRQAQSRIQAVACIHRHLQGSRDGNSLEIAASLAEIARETIAVLGVEDHIGVTISCPQRLVVATDRAVAVLLILTELLTNAFKHAYPGRTRGSVRVTVRDTPHRLVLQIDDDGRGLPRDFEPGSANGLGMRIVQGLVAQLHGELQIDAGSPGTHFQVRLPWDATRETLGSGLAGSGLAGSGLPGSGVG